MGCDIHMYIQYRNIEETERRKERNQKSWWHCFGNSFNPGRNYTLFGILAGVRDYPDDESKGYDPRGLPPFELGWVARGDNTLYITEDPNSVWEEGMCSLENAKRWGEHKIVNNDKGKPWYTTNPDWHSHTWLSTKELAQAYRWYKSASGYALSLEYRVLLKTMKALEDGGENEVFVVFWFDN